MKVFFLNTRRMSELTAGIAAAGSLLSPLRAQDKPNLIYIFPDELRRPACGFWSQPEYAGALNGTSDPVVTPTIDKLASEGVVFSQAMSTQPLSSPYRGMLLTGMFPEQNGIKRNCFAGNNEQLKTDAVCITDVLFQNGYSTAYFGKAHWQKTQPLFDATGNYVGSLTSPGGNYMNSYDTYIPPGQSRHSNEYWFQNIRDNHFNPYSYSNDPGTVGGNTDGQVYKPHRYTPEIEANHILAYLKNTSLKQRDTTKPFCIFWALNPPHMPYSAITDVDSVAYNTYYKNLPLTTLLNRPNVTTTLANGNVRYYFANVTGVDKQIGRVISYLDSAGYKDNTIVVFTSDHGEMMGSHNLMAKNVEYEEAYGVPFIIRYPKKLGHRIEKLLLGSTDIMPTLLGLMGLGARIPAVVKGTDYSPILIDTASTAVKKPLSTPYSYVEDVTTALDYKKGIRTDKYTFTIDSSCAVVSLYNNITDPYQRTNLTFSSLPAADQLLLKTQLGYWLARMNDRWYQQRRQCSYITYPVVPVVNSGKTAGQRPVLDITTATFSTSADIRLNLPAATRVAIRIFNASGRLVATVCDGNFSAGVHNLRWNGRDCRNSRVTPGVYIFECKTAFMTSDNLALFLR